MTAKIHVELNGQVVPLAILDWALHRPCGCVQSILLASSPMEEDAWREFFEGEPRRARLIEQRKRAGWRVGLIRASKAHAELMRKCPHVEGQLELPV